MVTLEDVSSCSKMQIQLSFAVSQVTALKALSPARIWSLYLSRHESIKSPGADLETPTLPIVISPRQPEPGPNMICVVRRRLADDGPSQRSIIVNMQQIFCGSGGLALCQIVPPQSYREQEGDRWNITTQQETFITYFSFNGRLIRFIKDDITKTDASATFLSALRSPSLLRLSHSVTGVTAVKLRHAALLYVNIAPARPGLKCG